MFQMDYLKATTNSWRYKHRFSLNLANEQTALLMKWRRKTETAHCTNRKEGGTTQNPFVADLTYVVLWLKY